MQVVLLLLVAASAQAHGLHQRRAEVLVAADRVITTIVAEAGSETEILDELAIRNGEGERLTGRVLSASEPDGARHVTLRLEHPLGETPRWLSFQLAPRESAGARVRRLELAVRSAMSDDEARRVVLTGGGNVETLRFGGGETGSACGPGLLDRPERASSMQALLRAEPQRTRLDLVLPLGLVESWIAVPRGSRDSLTVPEQEAISAPIIELVTRRIRLQAGADALPAGQADVTFLGLDDEALAEPLPRRRDAWTARVRVSLHFAGTGRLAWDLWNARITHATIIRMAGDQCTTHRLSAYDPLL